MYHKIGALAKHFGITTQALRFYEQHGLLVSEREEGTGARRYHARNFKWLYSIRRYHDLGFGLEETLALFSQTETEGLADMLRAKEDETRDEIAALEARLSALRRQEADLLRIPELLDAPRLDRMPELWLIVNQHGQDIDLSPEMAQTVQSWMRCLPFVYGASVIDAEAFSRPDEPLARRSGFCAELDTAERLGLKPGASAVRVGGAESIHLVTRLRPGGTTLRPLLGCALDFAEARGLTICGSAVGRCVGKTGEAHCRDDLCPKEVYYEYWIPVSGS